MLISHDRRFIFIHIYKNAGTSITQALLPFAVSRWHYMANRLLRCVNVQYFGPRTYHPHIRAADLAEKIGKDTFKSYFSFAIVRNPWDWQVSLYRYALKERRHRQHELVKGLGSFEAYLRWRCGQKVTLQRDFVCVGDGRLLVDFVARHENLENDFREICAKIGVTASLPRMNVSNTTPYQQYYNDETRVLVQSTYEPDIALFNYTF